MNILYIEIHPKKPIIKFKRSSNILGITYMKSVRNELQRRSSREYNVGWKVVDYASM